MGAEKPKRKLRRMLTAMVLGAVIWTGPAGTGYVQAEGTGKDIVDPYQVYSYTLMLEDMNRLAAAYPDLIQLKTIGTTVFGREIKALKLGRGEASILIDGSQHAREWISTNLILYMIDRYAYAYEHNMKYDEYVVRELLDNCSIWFVPMVNPDGVTLQQEGVGAFPEYYRSYLLSMNGGSYNFKRWKANAEGIDINRQYPAMWTGIRNSPAYPMYKNYKGAEPADTAEAQSMIHFTYNADPEITLSYHTSGEVLYWYFHNAPENLARDKGIANTITRMTGYGQVQPAADPSGGGYTDWFIAQFGRPGFTAELGHYQEETEVPLWAFDEIWGENQTMGLYLASEGYKLWNGRYPVQPVQEQLQLLKPVQLYNRPSESFPTGAELGSAQVTADARLGDWVRIPTWMGLKWVCLKQTDYLPGHAEDANGKISLKEQTNLYSYPKAETNLLLGQVNPQEVTVLKRWSNWILIETWFGTSWIEEKK